MLCWRQCYQIEPLTVKPCDKQYPKSQEPANFRRAITYWLTFSSSTWSLVQNVYVSPIVKGARLKWTHRSMISWAWLTMEGPEKARFISALCASPHKHEIKITCLCSSGDLFAVIQQSSLSYPRKFRWFSHDWISRAWAISVVVWSTRLCFVLNTNCFPRVWNLPCIYFVLFATTIKRVFPPLTAAPLHGCGSMWLKW